jgi:hypothetical protein
MRLLFFPTKRADYNKASLFFQHVLPEPRLKKDAAAER